MTKNAHDPVTRLGQTIAEALAKPAAKYPLRRHRDDGYVDEVSLSAAGGVRLHASIVPRYKTSGLSGDEWRISAVLEVFQGASERPFFTRAFHSMRRLFEYSPKFLYEECRDVLGASPAVLRVSRKGVECFGQSFPTFGQAAIGLGWHVTVANEGTAGVEWHHLTNEEELARCQQVGCAAPPVNLFHLKQIDEGKSGGHLVTPPYDFVGQYVWYCARHTTRGNCGLEDADRNLELVAGAGLARPHAGDEAESAFGGVIGVGGGGDGK